MGSWIDLDDVLAIAERAFKHPFGRVHGNGFVQLDDPEEKGNRVHIWGHPAIPAQKTPTPIHNHRFGFVSTTLVGRMVNVRYALLRGTTHHVYEPTIREGEDTVLHPTGGVHRIACIDVDECFAGESYAMDPGEFHETFVSGITVTVMQKTGSVDAIPQVLCRAGQEPDNQFHRYAAENRQAAEQAVAAGWEAVKKEWMEWTI